MDGNHPITPPDGLVGEWECDLYDRDVPFDTVIREAYRAGADWELEACCEWLDTYVPRYCEWSANFRAARRLAKRARAALVEPKPPSLKELALAALDDAVIRGDCITTSDELPAIRRALEALPDA